MFWLIGIGCLALGVIIGALSANRLSGTPTRIKELESQVKSLEERHDQYKDDVSDHFNVTADLVQQMTQSYRDVYQHLATGAQDLCTSEVANKLLPAGADAVFGIAGSVSGALGFTPPKDYATKQSPDQKGALAEDFGIEKTSAGEDEPLLSEELDDNESSQQEEQDNQLNPDDSQEHTASDIDEATAEKTDFEDPALADDEAGPEKASEEDEPAVDDEPEWFDDQEEEKPQPEATGQEALDEDSLDQETENQDDEEQGEKDSDAGNEDEAEEKKAKYDFSDDK